MSQSIWIARAIAAVFSTIAAMSSAHGQVQLTGYLESVDKQFVDVASGKFRAGEPALTIGGPLGGLAFSREWKDNRWRHSYAMSIAEAGFFGATNATVWIGAQSDTFSASSGVYTSSRGLGSTLVANATSYTYTARDGAVLTFDKGQSGILGIQPINAAATQVVFPSGETLQLFYRKQAFSSGTFVRLQSVVSSLGYHLKLQYLQDDAANNDAVRWSRLAQATAINTAVEYCDPAALACTGLTQSWPRYTYAYATVGATTQETVTDLLGRSTRYTYNTGGQLIAIKRPASTADNVQLGYDASGRVATLNDGSGIWTYSWTLANNVLTSSMQNSSPALTTRITTASAVSGALLTERVAGGQDTVYTYDSQGRLTRVTYPEGNYVNYTLDGRGNRTQITYGAKPSSGQSNIVELASYPLGCGSPKTCNKPLSTTDARGQVTDYTYDSNTGFVSTITLPAPTLGAVRPQLRYTYSPLYAYFRSSGGGIVPSAAPISRLTSVSKCRTQASCSGGADETKRTLSYGTPGLPNNLLPISDSIGSGSGSLVATATHTYDQIGNRVAVDGPLAGASDTTRFYFDSARQLRQIVRPDPDGGGPLQHRSSALTYTLNGQIATASEGTSASDGSAFSALRARTLEYDTRGRMTIDRTVVGATIYNLIQHSYDAASRLNCSAIRMNPATFAALPSSACTHATAGGFGPDRITRGQYSTGSEPVSGTSAFGVPGQERTTSTLTYTPNGKPSTLVDANGNKTTYEYDGHDRLVKTRYPSPTTTGLSSTTDFEQTTYDSAGNETSKRLRNGSSIDYTYDYLGRVILKDLPGSELDVTYTYDNDGRMLSASTIAQTLTFSFDALGRQTTESGPLGTMQFGYDEAGRRTSITWPDGAVTTYTFDLANNVTGIYEGAGTAVSMVQYAYDNLGSRKSVTRRYGANTSYGHDAVGRLTSISHDFAGSTYDHTVTLATYSPSNQITSRSLSNDLFAWTLAGNGNVGYANNGLNQISSVMAVPVSHDANGNVSASFGTSYTYGAENRLLSTSSGVSLSYDPLGRLYEVTQSGNTTRFQYIGGAISSEYSAGNARLRRHVPGGAIDEPAFTYEGAGIGPARWYHADERGSIVAVSDNQGAVVAVNAYNEYGAPQNTSLSAGRFHYTGQAWIPELGLLYFKARFYSY